MCGLRAHAHTVSQSVITNLQSLSNSLLLLQPEILLFRYFFFPSLHFVFLFLHPVFPHSLSSSPVPSPPSEPNFVSSYDIGNFTYFFFRENAVEHDCGRTVFSRAGRVCKNDIGGRFLLEDTWTTFMKARLNCSRPGEIPFNYNELQGTFYLPELELLYGIFTTNV